MLREKGSVGSVVRRGHRSSTTRAESGFDRCSHPRRTSSRGWSTLCMPRSGVCPMQRHRSWTGSHWRPSQGEAGDCRDCPPAVKVGIEAVPGGSGAGESGGHQRVMRQVASVARPRGLRSTDSARRPILVDGSASADDDSL